MQFEIQRIIGSNKTVGLRAGIDLAAESQLGAFIKLQNPVD